MVVKIARVTGLRPLLEWNGNYLILLLLNSLNLYKLKALFWLWLLWRIVAQRLRNSALEQWFSTQTALRPVFSYIFFPRPAIEGLKVIWLLKVGKKVKPTTRLKFATTRYRVATRRLRNADLNYKFPSLCAIYSSC